MDARRLLLDLYDAALRAVEGRACVDRALRAMELPQDVSAFAIGKAASSMLAGARDVLGARIQRALLITKDGHADPALRTLPGFSVIESGHPVPDDRSLAAGSSLMDSLATPGNFPLFLISGGSSSLVESLADGVTLADLQELNRRGLGAGWDIARLNTERARLSRLKGGGVARVLGSRPGLALFISDVPADDPDIIGSGLLGVAPGHPDRIARRVIACVDDAKAAAVEAGRHQGLELEVRPGNFAGDVEQVARDFLAALRDAGDGLVWGGESTVRLPESPGRGGRNQHLALLMAQALKPDERFTILAAGTDGTDGSTDDAGAIVDSGSMSRAELGGVDVVRALRDFNSGLALEAAQDLMHTGPTGTNVGDILIGIKDNARYVRGSAAERML
jgi:hydroxypyruvate reductase